MNLMMELRQRRATLIDEVAALNKTAEVEDRDFNESEQADYDAKLAEIDALESRAQRLEKTTGLQGSLEARQAPTTLTIGRGDTEERAMGYFLRSGKVDHLPEEMRTEGESGSAGIVLRLPSQAERRAVTDSTMNITTAADGGNTVPTGFVQDIATRKSEMMLADKLGVRRIPGKGTTVNYPNENEDPQSFVVTAEQSDAHDVAFSRNAPQTDLVAFTLVFYTRSIELTAQLMRDEDANLMAYLSDKIAREYAQTHNGLLVTEAAASGTALKTYASATAIAAGEPEDIVFNDTLSYYLDEGNSNGWITRPSTFGSIASITGNARLYAQTPGGSFQKEILGYPVSYSNRVAATAASAKDLYFGNWYYMGMREDPALTLLVNPYRVAGMTILDYSFGAVYKQLQAGAIGYGVHPSA